MLLKKTLNSSMIGFTYYPLLENALGFFFLFMAITVPIFFYKCNGFKMEQWNEWLFLLIFFVLFFFLGKSLAYQNMLVSVKNDKISLFQDMREPSVKLELPLEKWKGAYMATIADEKHGEVYRILLKTENEELEFYQTTSKSEAKVISVALNKIYTGEGKQYGKEQDSY